MDLRHLGRRTRCLAYGHRWTAWWVLKPLLLIARCCEKCGKIEFDPTRDEIARLPGP